MAIPLLQKATGGVQKIEDSIRPYQFLSGSALKVIAILAMTVDHLCKIILQWLVANYWSGMVSGGQMSLERFQQIDEFIRFRLQSVGALAFPLFCFLLSEGFRYTHSKKRYLLSMLAFALISELPFDVAFFGRLAKLNGTFPFYFKYQNVFFTLFLGLLTLVCLEKLSCNSEARADKRESCTSWPFIFAVNTGFIKCFCFCWHIWARREISRPCASSSPACLFFCITASGGS